MLRRIQPEVGIWYENTEQGMLFEVVALDDEESTLAIQYFDGALEEIDIETFWQLPLRTVDQPEDWAGPYEIEAEDRNDQETGDWSSTQPDQYLPFDEFESDSVRIYDDS